VGTTTGVALIEVYELPWPMVNAGRGGGTHGPHGSERERSNTVIPLQIAPVRGSWTGSGAYGSIHEWDETAPHATRIFTVFLKRRHHRLLMIDSPHKETNCDDEKRYVLNRRIREDHARIHQDIRGVNRVPDDTVEAPPAHAAATRQYSKAIAQGNRSGETAKRAKGDHRFAQYELPAIGLVAKRIKINVEYGSEGDAIAPLVRRPCDNRPPDENKTAIIN
jgi:hypothetical protein